MDVYSKKIDAGHGEHILITNSNKIIIHQFLKAKNGSYTGNGNPAIIGKKIEELKKFRKVSGTRADCIIDCYLDRE